MKIEKIKYIFWGNIFILFFFTINGFDIIPDFIGYILIMIALVNLDKFSKKFKPAFFINLILCVLSIINITGIFNFLNDSLIAFYIYHFACTALLIANTYFMYSGFSDISKSNNDLLLAKDINNKMFIFISFRIALQIIYCFNNLINTEILYLIAGLGFAIFELIYIYKLSKILPAKYHEINKN